MVRFERFDESPNAMIIGLFNPGKVAMEINHTKLFYQEDNNTSKVTFNNPDYSGKPLVSDPGDTILIPLKNSISDYSDYSQGLGLDIIGERRGLRFLAKLIILVCIIELVRI